MSRSRLYQRETTMTGEVKGPVYLYYINKVGLRTFLFTLVFFVACQVFSTW